MKLVGICSPTCFLRYLRAKESTMKAKVKSSGTSFTPCLLGSTFRLSQHQDRDLRVLTNLRIESMTSCDSVNEPQEPDFMMAFGLSFPGFDSIFSICTILS